MDVPRGAFQPRFDISGMVEKVEGNDKGIVVKLVYYNKDGKEFTALSQTFTKEQLEKQKERLENNLAVLNDPTKTQASKDTLTANIADLKAKIELVK